MKTLLLASLIGMVLCHPLVCFAQNYSGQWLGTVTESVNHCKNLGKAEVGEYKLTIVHKNEDITIMENVVQRPYKGVVRPDRPMKVHVQGNYVDDGGYVSELIEITFESDAKGKGKGVWGWSDGYYECGGRYAFTLEKIRD